MSLRFANCRPSRAARARAGRRSQIARIYQESGQTHRAIQFLKKSLPGYYSVDIAALPRAYWEILFPRPYWTDLQRQSMANSLDPYLVASLIRQESEFNPGAVSNANAYGLMQLLPQVGRGEARAAHIKHFSTASLLVPTLNIQLGTHYFKEMVTQYSGQVEYALAAYNAGSNRVDEWLQSGTLSRRSGVCGVDSVHRNQRVRAGNCAQCEGVSAAVSGSISSYEHRFFCQG